VVVDSGAGAHLSPHIESFDENTMYVPSPPVHLTTANGSRTKVELMGNAHVITTYGGYEFLIVLKNAMYVPGCAHVLISGSLAHDAGLVQNLVSGTMTTSTGEIMSRLVFNKSRVLVLEGADAAPTASRVRRLRECRRRVAQSTPGRWVDATAPFAARAIASSCIYPTPNDNQYAALSESAEDVHDTYDVLWSDAQQLERHRAACSARTGATSARNVVTLAVMRRKPEVDYATTNTGRVRPANDTSTDSPTPRPPPAKLPASHAASAQHTSVRVNRSAPPSTASNARAQPSGVPVRAVASVAPGVGGASAGEGAAAVVRPRFPVGGAAVGGVLRSASLTRGPLASGGEAADGARASALPTPPRPPPKPQGDTVGGTVGDTAGRHSERGTSGDMMRETQWGHSGGHGGGDTAGGAVGDAVETQ
jgi:hypothetical protein